MNISKEIRVRSRFQKKNADLDPPKSLDCWELSRFLLVFPGRVLEACFTPPKKSNLYLRIYN